MSCFIGVSDILFCLYYHLSVLEKMQFCVTSAA